MNEIKKYKSLYDISWKVTEEEYRADPAYSYSTLSRFNREGFEGLSSLYDKIESPSLVFGSLVDVLLTGDKKELEDNFMVGDFPEISDALIEIAKTLFNKYKVEYTNLTDIPDEILKEVGRECGYYANPKYDSYRVKLIKENCDNYYNLLFLSEGKNLITSKLYNDALECTHILKTNPFTKNYFAPDNPFDNSIQNFNQLKFKMKYPFESLDGKTRLIELRCMLDKVIVDHTNKIVYPIDLKTSYDKEYNFYHHFIKWGYWIQAQLYWEILRVNLANDAFFKDYTLKDFRFIVISNNNRKPLVWNYSETQVIVDSYYGKNNEIELKNWRNIVKELDYYLQNNLQYPLGISHLNEITEWLKKL